LVKALEEIARGLVDAQLGDCLYKKRIGVAGRGKSGGIRAILIYKDGDLAVFLHGYAKNEKDNLSPQEQEALKVFSKAFLKLSIAEREKRTAEGALVEIEKRAKRKRS